MSKRVPMPMRNQKKPEIVNGVNMNSPASLKEVFQIATAAADDACRSMEIQFQKVLLTHAILVDTVLTYMKTLPGYDEEKFNEAFKAAKADYEEKRKIMQAESEETTEPSEEDAAPKLTLVTKEEEDPNARATVNDPEAE